MPTLSVIVITRNEAHDIRGCLDSVQWADEIIVLDSGSTDGTQAICREYTDKVYVTDWPGYGKQKNRALEKASGDWVLSLDADERVTPPLQEEIRAAIQTDRYAAYEIPLDLIFYGRRMKRWPWHQERHLRLFRRSAGRFSDRIIHEKTLIDGPVSRLKGHIEHFSYRNLEELLDKTNQYSTAGAQFRHGRGDKAGFFAALIHAEWTFIKSYVLNGGLLNGKEGFIFAVSNAEGVYYRYLKLLYMPRN